LNGYALEAEAGNAAAERSSICYLLSARMRPRCRFRIYQIGCPLMGITLREAKRLGTQPTSRVNFRSLRRTALYQMTRQRDTAFSERPSNQIRKSINRMPGDALNLFCAGNQYALSGRSLLWRGCQAEAPFRSPVEKKQRATLRLCDGAPTDQRLDLLSNNRIRCARE